MSIVGSTIPSPPERLTGNVQEDLYILHTYLIDLFQSLVVGASIVSRMDEIAQVALDSIPETSNPPTQQDVATLRTALIAIVQAAKGE